MLALCYSLPTTTNIDFVSVHGPSMDIPGRVTAFEPKGPWTDQALTKSEDLEIVDQRKIGKLVDEEFVEINFDRHPLVRKDGGQPPLEHVVHDGVDVATIVRAIPPRGCCDLRRNEPVPIGARRVPLGVTPIAVGPGSVLGFVRDPSGEYVRSRTNPDRVEVGDHGQELLV